MNLPGRLPPEDDGCELHPFCLTCPFPVSIHDLPRKHHKSAAEHVQDDEVRRIMGETGNVRETARRTGLSYWKVRWLINPKRAS